VISRAAESCFWLVRYVERCHATARLLQVHSGMVLDTLLPPARAWCPLLIVQGEGPHFEELYGLQAATDGEAVQRYLTWDERCPVSIARSLRAARESARTVRETISLEMWNAVNSFWLWLNDEDTRKTYDGERQTFYEEVGVRGHLFSGTCHNTMLHEEPYEFMRLGSNIERAGQTARILDLQHHALAVAGSLPAEAVGAAEWIAILRTCYAYEPFFKKRKAPLSGEAVAEFLLLDRAFPGSVLHAVTQAQRFLRQIRPWELPEIGRKSAWLLGELLSFVVNLEMERVLQDGIHEVLTAIVERTDAVSQAIAEDYFYAARPEKAGGLAAGATQA
jgi:uncharacterized alpha-E superfamily protein